jgi:hypothetical protein
MYAPVPKNAAWPKDRRPANPRSRFRDAAKIAKQNTFIMNRSYTKP